MGVSLDWSPSEGAAFLARLGQFDEIASGRNWLNSGAVRYIFRDLPGLSQVPQVIVVERNVRVRPEAIDVGPERLITRKVGLDEMLQWAQQLEADTAHETVGSSAQ
jgi:hypothetical protein